MHCINCLLTWIALGRLSSSHTMDSGWSNKVAFNSGGLEGSDTVAFRFKVKGQEMTVFLFLLLSEQKNRNNKKLNETNHSNIQIYNISYQGEVP